MAVDAAEEGAVEQARPPLPLVFTSRDRVRNAPQRLDASLLAAPLYGKRGSADNHKKEAAAVAAEEEESTQLLVQQQQHHHHHQHQQHQQYQQHQHWQEERRGVMLCRTG